MPNALQGRRVATVATEMVERVELTEPRREPEQAGAEVAPPTRREELTIHAGPTPA